jgi:hypothetical protein
MEQPLPPCSECGERRVIFHCAIDDPQGYNLRITSLGFFASGVKLYACTYLGCGSTTLRPDPDDMEKLRKAAEKGKTVQF